MKKRTLVKKDSSLKKLWLARDYSRYDSDDDEEYYGEVVIFYDKPILEGGKWGCAREIARCPNYMFPEIEEGELKIFYEVPITV